MGCDIHMVVERRDPELGWVGLHDFPYGTVELFTEINGKSEFVAGRPHWLPCSRNYELFAEIAGVRGDGPEPRGMPGDASDLARMEVRRWGDDGHSHTWLLMSEAVRPFGVAMLGEQGWAKLVADKVSGEPDWDTTGKVLDRFGIGLSDDDETLDDYRLIIWFDN